jgi:hypothetical protein
MMKWTVLIFIVSTIPLANAQNKLKPFVTDNCTMFVDGTVSNPFLWRDCCVEHDLRYWFGGSSSSQDFSDLQLKSCVTKKSGTFYANLIYYGVRAGHHFPIKHKYVWGWGWLTTREKYTKLMSSEKAIIREELNHLEFEPEYIDNFKDRYNLN